MNKGDKRVQRTEDDIENAVLELMAKNKYQEITIKKIIAESRYSRTAFYLHYRNKDDCFKHLLDKQIAVHLSDSLQEFVQAIPNKQPISDYAILCSYFEHIYKRRIFYKALFCNDSFSKLKNYFYARLLQEASRNITIKSRGDIDKELYVYSLTSGLLGCIEYWVKEDFKFTPDYIARQFCLTKDTNGNNIVAINYPSQI